MKKIVAFLLIFLFLYSAVFNGFSLFASETEYSGNNNGISWRYIPEGKTLFIDGEHPEPFVDCVPIDQPGPNGHGAETVYYVPFTDYYVKQTPWQNLDIENLVIGTNVKRLPSGLIQRNNLNTVTFLNGSFSVGLGAFFSKTADSDGDDCRIGFMALTEKNIISRGVHWKGFQYFYPNDPRYGSDRIFFGYKINTLYLDGFPLDLYYYLLRDYTEHVIINDKKYDSLTCEVETEGGTMEYNILEDGKKVSFTSGFSDLCRKWDFHKNSYSVKNLVNCEGVPYSEVKKHEFKDVNPKKWYYDSVKYECEVGLFSGLDKYTFAPDSPLSRAMLVSLLYRNDYKDYMYSSAIQFSDVANNAWYKTPVLWARYNNIVYGVTEDLFMPDSDIRREDLAVILYRYANHRGLDTSGRADITTYPDYEDVDEYAREAVSWAVYEGYISGDRKNDGSVRLEPLGNTTRAQASSIFMRYHLKNGDPVLGY